MIRLEIDNREVSVQAGTTVLSAARMLGIDIPTMCYLEEAGIFTSCMICMVRDERSGKLLPSCSALVQDDMKIITSDEEISEARKMALELLLSDHTGDCEAPCQVTCPAHMNIPLMNRLLASGQTGRALEVVLEDIPLPAILGRICPAPCEGACRRKSVDEAVSICLLKRFAGDTGGYPENPAPAKTGGAHKRIAIIGAGPAGLTAGYYLSQKGYKITLFDKNEAPGGMLRYGVPREELPLDVLDLETSFVLGGQIDLKTGSLVDAGSFKKLSTDYDAVIIASGDIDDNVRSWGLTLGSKGIEVSKNTYQTSVPHVFAIGNVLRPAKMAVRSVGQGKAVAASVEQFLSGREVSGEHREFNSRFGKLTGPEITEYLKEGTKDSRTDPAGGPPEGFLPEEVRTEAARCLHCDCRDLHTCQLRKLSDTYLAQQKRFSSGTRQEVRKKWVHDTVIHEPAKCIKCGICVRLTETYRDKYGFTFIGRGFDVEIGVAFDEDLRGSLKETAEKVAMACPTGALTIEKFTS